MIQVQNATFKYPKKQKILTKKQFTQRNTNPYYLLTEIANLGQPEGLRAIASHASENFQTQDTRYKTLVS